MEPLCKYFGQCGGCSAQNILYEVQLENKRKKIASHVKVDPESINIFHDIDYHYRNRMDLIFHPGGIGFRKRHKWQEIVDIEKCVIANDKINQYMNEIRTFFKSVDSFDVIKLTGTYRYAVIRSTSIESSISFVLNENSNRLSNAIDKIKNFSKKTSCENIIVTYVPAKADLSVGDEFFVVKGSDSLRENLNKMEFSFHVQGFFQNNTKMAEKMILYTKDLFKKYDTKNVHLLDLYGGVGTFGIINAELFKEVLVVESLKQSIDAALLNIKKNNIQNGDAKVLDAMQLKKLELKQPLFVLTDPPRSGMHPKTIIRLNELQPEVIIYVSCNHEQLGKELPKFANYEIKSVALFDLFPQTNHCEVVVELVRKQ